MRLHICGLVAVVACAGVAQASVLEFDLMGRAGAGLLSGNELHTVVGANVTGGEIQTGITFDTDTNALNIAVGWGSFFGFTGALTGNATGMHIHGPADMNTNAGVLVGLDGLPGFNPTPNGGCYVGTVTLSATQAQHLLNGLLYINVHTAASGGGLNPSGEIRANLVLVPAPGAMGLAAIGGLVAMRRRRA